MKICILTPRFPFPENGGDVLRINNISRYLKGKGHTLILVSYISKDDENKVSEPLYDKIYYIRRNKFVSFVNSTLAFIINKPIQLGYYFSFAYLFAFRRIVKSECPDLYIAHLLRMVPYLNLCRLQDKSIVEMTDALSKTYRVVQNASKLSIKRIIYQFEEKRIAKYEQKTVNAYKKCILVSQVDKEFLESHFNM
jgi:glycosyltransferase involved in cell wall biosynthesis